MQLTNQLKMPGNDHLKEKKGLIKQKSTFSFKYCNVHCVKFVIKSIMKFFCSTSMTLNALSHHFCLKSAFVCSKF